jgi:hypothetical protein
LPGSTAAGSAGSKSAAPKQHIAPTTVPLVTRLSSEVLIKASGK